MDALASTPASQSVSEADPLRVVVHRQRNGEIVGEQISLRSLSLASQITSRSGDPAPPEASLSLSPIEVIQGRQAGRQEGNRASNWRLTPVVEVGRIDIIILDSVSSRRRRRRRRRQREKRGQYFTQSGTLNQADPGSVLCCGQPLSDLT